MTNAIVVYRVVEPNKGSKAVGGCFEKVQIALVDHIGHAITCPHYLNALMQAIAQAAQIGIVLVPTSISCIILSRTHRQLIQIVVLHNKVFPHIVAFSHLQVSIGTTKVVEEDREVAHTERVNVFQLIHNGFEIAFAVIDRATRVDSPHKRYVVLLSCFGQAANNGSFIIRVVFSPLFAMVRVVFGTIHVDVQLVLTIEVELTLTVGIAPRVSVETFDHTTLGASWIVLNFNAHHVRLCQYL